MSVRFERFERLELAAALDEKLEEAPLFSNISEVVDTKNETIETVEISNNDELLEEASITEAVETKTEEIVITDDGVIEAVGEWSILSCQSTSTNKGICSVK